MKKLLAILLLATISLTAQKFTTKSNGYQVKVFYGDSLISQHSQYYKAKESAENFLRSRRDVEKVVIQYSPFEVSVDWSIAPMQVLNLSGIEQSDPTSTSIFIYIPLEVPIKLAYIKFRELGGIWQETNKDKTNILSPFPLKQDTDYEYIVYVEDLDGNKVNSDLLTFKTKKIL